MNDKPLHIFEIDYNKDENIFTIYLTNSDGDWYMKYNDKELKNLIEFLSQARKGLPKKK